MIKVLEKEECLQLLRDNYIGHLAYISGGSPHVLPITYYYDEATDSLISYSTEGHKIRAMRENTSVSLGVNEIDSVKNWRSILVQGIFEELDGSNAKKILHLFAQGIKDLITGKGALAPRFISDFSSKIYADGIPIVYRIKIIEITGKFREDL